MLVRHNTPGGDVGQMCTPATEPARTLPTTGHQSLVGWPPAVPVPWCTGLGTTMQDPYFALSKAGGVPEDARNTT
jgi:DNA (cytosine-5)-methyltransferase 1